MSMFWIFITCLWAAMLLSPFILLFLFLPVGRDCPRCAQETLPMKSRMLQPARRLMMLRWCIACGWEGIARNAVSRNPLPKLEVVPDDGKDGEEDQPWKQSA
jgi:hypothetical protein